MGNARTQPCVVPCRIQFVFVTAQEHAMAGASFFTLMYRVITALAENLPVPPYLCIHIYKVPGDGAANLYFIWC